MREKSKSMCSGCYNEEYWYGLGGAEKCWSFESARVEKKLQIPVDMRPPYDKKQAKSMLSCYNKKRYVMVKPDALNSEGFWKW